MTDPFDGPDVPLFERPPTRKANVMAATGLVASLLLAVLTVAPSPFAIADAGPTFDTLGSVDDVPVITIDGLPTYDSTGELRLTTVSFSRGSSRTFTLGQVIQGFWSSHRTVTPDESVFGTADTQDQVAQQSAQQWITSQESATVSALEELGYTVPVTLTVASIIDESKAKGVLQEGDVLRAIDGSKIETYSDLTDALAARSPGDTVTFTVDRGGKTSEATFALIPATDDPSVARMGIYVDPVFDLPITVNVGVPDVSGPSAGMMFALAIMDKLTPQDELNGEHVAGTGTIDVDGDVGPIGGIAHKLDGARAAGATSFLAPVENCPEVLGHIPAGLDVYAVDNLADAYAAVIAIGRHNTTDLPTCASVANKE